MSSSLKRSWSDRSCQTRIQKCWFPVKVYWDTGRLGMKLVEQDGVLVVRRTQKGTWADEMKLRIGDELVSINGQAVSQMREHLGRYSETFQGARAHWTAEIRCYGDGLSVSLSLVFVVLLLPRQQQDWMRLPEACLGGCGSVTLAHAERWSVQELKAACLHAASGSPPCLAQRKDEQELGMRCDILLGLEVRADEDRAVDAVVTALLHTLEDPEKKQEIQSNARTEDPMHELAAEVHEEDTQITDPAEPAKPIGLIEPEPSQPSEPADPTLLADVESREPRERQYSDFEEFENDEPSEYEDVFEIDDEENTPANKESGKSSNPESGYPGTTPAIAAPSMANLETEASHERRVVFAETREDLNIVLEGRIGQGDTNAQANHPSLEKKVSFSDDAGVDSATAKAMRKGTGFVSQEDLPDSEDDEEDETDEIQIKVFFAGNIAALTVRLHQVVVSGKSEAGTDSEQVQAMRKGTGFVPMRDLPDSDDEDSKDPEDQEAEEEAGTDSETARAMRKGTGYVPMSQIARLGSDEDTADEVDEIRHVSFSPDTATSNETNASHRKGTGYVQMSDLPDDEDEEGVDEIADKKVSFADAQDPASKNGSQASSTRKGTGYVATRNLPESEDEEDETDEIQAPPGCGERKVSFSQEAGTDSERVQAMRKGTGFVPMRDLPDSDDEDSKVDPEDEEDAYDDEEFEDEEQEA
ncbi:unnamed protein product [Cladocopium goreaui]|uniref:Serine/threonine-protein kinase ppk5 n=1 Tax=Cladocopium goreaui TaxID=2562237 RepID=A0A9P1CDY4_9DINO|nr:unnamed protein product [Cladocopium goreaui]